MLASTLFATLAVLSSTVLGAPTSASIEKRLVSSKITANNGKCLGFTGTTEISNGTPIGTVDCASDKAIEWVFDVERPSRISPKSNLDFSLDAGSNPANYGKLKLWQNYPGLFQQTFWYTADLRIAIYNGDQCLDDGEGGQTWQCTTGNTNQIWKYKDSGNGGNGGNGGDCTATATVIQTVTVTAVPDSPTTTAAA